MSDITEEDVMKYCQSRNLMLVTKESLEYMHRPIAIETMNKNAIPVEWMKHWAMKNWIKSKKCEYDIIVSKMIDDWCKENEGQISG